MGVGGKSITWKFDTSGTAPFPLGLSPGLRGLRFM
ncbi:MULTISPECIES: hypothetical protein [Candidatus Accumulibacter]|nr:MULTISPECIES: hypothetical protein [Candidatus Accumulibacter]HNC19862.1 hypothetical protein [Accumulibacter sp.]HNL14788.1 hypothetical protein [Accumulibacter sp.]HNN46448.1 hypothetical protein [Azospira sp.]HRF11817.1 hypothetical protein [Candidatus Accumulibacter phosphatis]